MQMNLRRLYAIALTAAFTTILCACEAEKPADDTIPTSPQVQVTADEEKAMAQAALEGWQLAAPKAQNAARSAQNLLSAVEGLLQEPTPTRLQAARKQWHELALHYQPLELYGHLAELRPESFQHLRHLMYATGAYPIQPGYLDSFGPYQYSGLVHDVSIPITPETLREQHGLTDKEDATLGVYAIEFLLFGAPGGERPASDFEQQALTSELREQGFNNVGELPNNRRRQLLITQVRMLTDDLEQLARLWPPQAQESLYTTFASDSPLRRYLILLRSTRLELSRISTALASLHPSGVPDETAAETVPNSGLLPVSLLAARTKYLHELMKTLSEDEDLRQSSQAAHQALAELKNQESAEAVQAAIEAVTHALEELTAKLRIYAPESRPANLAPAEETGGANPPATDDKTGP